MQMKELFSICQHEFGAQNTPSNLGHLKFSVIKGNMATNRCCGKKKLEIEYIRLEGVCSTQKIRKVIGDIEALSRRLCQENCIG